MSQAGPAGASFGSASPNQAEGSIVTDVTNTVSTLPLTAGRWAIDTNHSRVGFAIRHLGVSKVRGRFADIDAELVIGDSLDSCAVNATVGLASIDTGNTDRDAHVRSADLLDVENRPEMVFKSLGIEDDGGDWVLNGELTIGEVTRSVRFDVEFGGVESFFDGTRHAGFEAVGEIRRKDFGLSFGPLSAMLGDVVKVELDLQFIEPAAVPS